MDSLAIAKLLTNPPPLLLEELVLSPDPPADVAMRHGVTEEVLNHAMANPVFAAKLAETKTKHERTGEFQRSVARYTFLSALETAHAKVSDPRTSPKDAIAWAETLASIGGIKQSAATEVSAGSGFVFNINLNGSTVTVESAKEPEQAEVIEGEATIITDDLPTLNVLAPAPISTLVTDTELSYVFTE